MQPFSQPVLSDDKDRLKNRLRHADFALSQWKSRLNTDSEYDQEFTKRNIDFFAEQVDNINERLNGI